MTIETIRGPMDESSLEKRVAVVEDERAMVETTEYLFEGEVVNKSAHVMFKQPPEAEASTSSTGGGNG